MFRYNWHCITDGGDVVCRWDADGAENVPDPWRTRQFHLFPTNDRSLPVVSIFVPKGARFRYVKRKHIDYGTGSSGEFVLQGGDRDVIYVYGWEHPDEPTMACYTFLLPDGRIEQSNDWAHVTRYERNLDAHPLSPYEAMGRPVVNPRALGDGMPPEGEQWADFFADGEVVADDDTSDDDTAFRALDETLREVDYLAFGRHLGLLAE